MGSHETTEASPAVRALGGLIAAHATLTRELSARLFDQHGLTLNEYEVLLLLSRAPDRSMRRVDIAARARLSPSGVTRMLDRLEATGLVEKGKCPEDGRVTYAVLTDAGVEKLRWCSRDHLAAVEREVGERLDQAEQGTLAELLGRLGNGADDCQPGS